MMKPSARRFSAILFMSLLVKGNEPYAQRYYFHFLQSDFPNAGVIQVLFEKW